MTSCHLYAGFGLIFIAYPEALAQLPISPLWCILFFVMVVVIGVDSQFTLIGETVHKHLSVVETDTVYLLDSLVLFWSVEVIITCICDSFPEVFETNRALITVIICVIIFFLAFPCITQVRYFLSGSEVTT